MGSCRYHARCPVIDTAGGTEEARMLDVEVRRRFVWAVEACVPSRALGLRLRSWVIETVCWVEEIREVACLLWHAQDGRRVHEQWRVAHTDMLIVPHAANACFERRSSRCSQRGERIIYASRSTPRSVHGACVTVLKHSQVGSRTRKRRDISVIPALSDHYHILGLDIGRSCRITL